MNLVRKNHRPIISKPFSIKRNQFLPPLFFWYMERGKRIKSKAENQWGFLEAWIVTNYPKLKLICYFVSCALTRNQLFGTVILDISLLNGPYKPWPFLLLSQSWYSALAYRVRVVLLARGPSHPWSLIKTHHRNTVWMCSTEHQMCQEAVRNSLGPDCWTRAEGKGNLHEATCM